MAKPYKIIEKILIFAVHMAYKIVFIDFAVQGNYKNVFIDNSTGEEVDGTGYIKWYGNTYYKIVRQGNQWVYVYATKTRVEYEATRLVTKTADYYKERTYYLDTKGFISKDNAQKVVDGLNDAINKPGELEGDLAQKLQDAEAAESA